MNAPETAQVLQKLLAEKEPPVVYERLAEEIFKQITLDDEGWHHVGRQVIQAFQEAPEASDNMLMALCGWSMKSLLIFSGLISDDEGLIK